jgi:hypothetical protein
MPNTVVCRIQRQWPNYDPIFKVDDAKMVSVLSTIHGEPLTST